MTNDALTARQTQILKSIIDEYIETSEPVGSLALEKKYNLGISPATIRNEMGVLTKKGFLRQPHTSAGRTPSPKAMKFYINQLMEEHQMSLAEEVKAKENVWDSRHDIDELMKAATKALSRRTDSLSVAATEEGDTWIHGHSHVFNSPEFFNFDVCQSLFSTLETHARLKELFFDHLTGVNPIEILFGEELGWDFFDPIGIVATRINVGDKTLALGVIGPYRLNYSSIIPTVRYFGDLVQQITQK